MKLRWRRLPAGLCLAWLLAAGLPAQATGGQAPAAPAAPEAPAAGPDEDADDEAEAPEYRGELTISRIRVVIDGFTWIQTSAGGEFRPAADNPDGLRLSTTRPETIMGLIGIDIGQRYAQAELQSLCAWREKQLSDSNEFFNNSIAVLPSTSDPARCTLVVDVKMGFTLRPSAGLAFASLTDLNIDGNFLVMGAGVGFNNDSFTIGHGIPQAGPFWWQATAGYQNGALGGVWPPSHTASLSGSLGSAWLPMSPWLNALVWGRWSPQGSPVAPWALSVTPHLSHSDKLKDGDLELGYGMQVLCPLAFYAPDWQLVAQPEIRLVLKPALGPVELAVQGSFAWSNRSSIDEISLNLATPDRAVRGGFASTEDALADRLLMGNAELRLKAINFPFWIFESVGIWPYAYLDMAATSRAAEPDWFGTRHLAYGGGLRLWLGIPVMLGFSFSYGWSEKGLGAFSFAVSTGY
jgi:hypothetical protein